MESVNSNRTDPFVRKHFVGLPNFWSDTDDPPIRMEDINSSGGDPCLLGIRWVRKNNHYIVSNSNFQLVFQSSWIFQTLEITRSFHASEIPIHSIGQVELNRNQTARPIQSVFSIYCSFSAILYQKIYKTEFFMVAEPKMNPICFVKSSYLFGLKLRSLMILLLFRSLVSSDIVSYKDLFLYIFSIISIESFNETRFEIMASMASSKKTRTISY